MSGILGIQFKIRTVVLVLEDILLGAALGGATGNSRPSEGCQIERGVVDSIRNYGHSADISIDRTGQRYSNVPIYSPYYHPANGQRIYSTIEPLCECVALIDASGWACIIGFGTGAQEGSSDVDSTMQSIRLDDRSDDAMRAATSLVGGTVGSAGATEALDALREDAMSYKKGAEKVAPGSTVIKSRFGNKIIVERGGFNYNFVTHLCQRLYTNIKNYCYQVLENQLNVWNGGRAHLHTYYDDNKTNIDLLI